MFKGTFRWSNIQIAGVILLPENVASLNALITLERTGNYYYWVEVLLQNCLGVRNGSNVLLISAMILSMPLQTTSGSKRYREGAC